MQAGAAWQKERPIRSNIETRSTKVAAPESGLTARFGVTPREARGGLAIRTPGGGSRRIQREALVRCRNVASRCFVVANRTWMPASRLAPGSEPYVPLAIVLGFVLTFPRVRRQRCQLGGFPRGYVSPIHRKSPRGST